MLDREPMKVQQCFTDVVKFGNFAEWLLSVDHAPESLSKYMTTIYHYFCIKDEYFKTFLK